ncbi:MAG TPA: SIMPL domain-containing protein [Dehalococcoidia bacterium]|nr:SIMPL domain-containing protein [Dehalococcoidia bacterium]
MISDLSLSSLPSPLWQMSTNGLTVQGYGLASAPADQALVYFYFSSGAPKPVPLPPSTSIAPAPITEESLRPIIEAIKGQGIADADIEVTLQPVYYQSDFSGSATIRVRVRDLGKVDGVIQAVQQAAGSVPQLTLNSANVQYTLADCSPLEQEAMKAAAEDARSRADLLARILGVGLGELIGATNWSYSPFGYPGCGQDNVRILSVVERGFIPGQSQEVQVSAALGLTFAIR